MPARITNLRPPPLLTIMKVKPRFRSSLTASMRSIVDVAQRDRALMLAKQVAPVRVAAVALAHVVVVTLAREHEVALLPNVSDHREGAQQPEATRRSTHARGVPVSPTVRARQPARRSPAAGAGSDADGEWRRARERATGGVSSVRRTRCVAQAGR